MSKSPDDDGPDGLPSARAKAWEAHQRLMENLQQVGETRRSGVPDHIRESIGRAREAVANQAESLGETLHQEMAAAQRAIAESRVAGSEVESPGMVTYVEGPDGTYHATGGDTPHLNSAPPSADGGATGSPGSAATGD
jgi:hypothetical protein